MKLWYSIIIFNLVRWIQELCWWRSRSSFRWFPPSDCLCLSCIFGLRCLFCYIIQLELPFMMSPLQVYPTMTWLLSATFLSPESDPLTPKCSSEVHFQLYPFLSSSLSCSFAISSDALFLCCIFNFPPCWVFWYGLTVPPGFSLGFQQSVFGWLSFRIIFRVEQLPS